MSSIEDVFAVEDIKNKKGVDSLVDLNSQQDLDALANKEEKLAIIGTTNQLNNFIDTDLKDTIKIEIGAHLLKGGKIDDFKRFLSFFPDLTQDDFILATAKQILSSVSNIVEGDYINYKEQMSKNGLWDDKNELIKGLQEWLGIDLKDRDGKLGKYTIQKLKNRITPENNFIDNNNYKADGEIIKGYVQDQYMLSKEKKSSLDLCSGFVLNVLEDILDKQGKTMKQKSVNAWELFSSLDTKYFSKKKIAIDPLEPPNTTKEKIVGQPKGTILTIRFEPTKNRTNDPGVSHVMISMGNGIYIDYIHKQSRPIDMKRVTFDKKEFDLPDSSGKRIKENKTYCTIEGKRYVFTADSAIISPIIEKFPDAEKRELKLPNITPMAFSKKIANEQSLPWEYVYTQMMKKNNFTTEDLNETKNEISIDIPSIKVQALNYTITDPDVKNIETAQIFLKTLKDKKGELMSLCNLDNKEYDNIATIAFGILGNESQYGEGLSFLEGIMLGASKHTAALALLTNKDALRGRLAYQAKKIGGDKLQDTRQAMRKAKGYIKKGEFADAYNSLANPNDTEYNSKGLTQIKYDLIMDKNPKLNAQYKSYGITESRLNEPYFAAIATFLFLADSYEWLKTYKIGEENYNKMKLRGKTPLEINDNNIFTYLPYTYNKPSQIFNGTATPDTSIYIANMNTNIGKLTPNMENDQKSVV